MKPRDLILVLLVTLERPTPLWVVLLLALAGLAYATRVQAVALGPAILLAPLLLAVFEGRGLRETVSRFRWLYGIVLAAARHRSEHHDAPAAVRSRQRPLLRRDHDADVSAVGR